MRSARMELNVHRFTCGDPDGVTDGDAVLEPDSEMDGVAEGVRVGL